MFAGSRLNLLRLTAVVIITITIALPIAAGILGGMFNTSFSLNQVGSTLYVNGFGRGSFATNLGFGHSVSLNFGISTVCSPIPCITHGRSGGNDVQLLDTSGSKLFGNISYVTTFSETNGVITITGGIHFFGGTDSYYNTSADATFTVTLSRSTNTGTFKFNTNPLFEPSPGPHACAVARFEYLGGPNVQRTAVVIAIWAPIALAALLRRRARQKKI